MIRGVAFDLGSTLIYFNGDWSQVLAKSRAFLAKELVLGGFDIDEDEFSAAFGSNLEENMDRRLRDNIEEPMSALLKETLNEFGLDTVDKVQIDDFLRRMYTISETHWQPVDGLHDVLEELRDDGFRMGVISNAADANNVQRLIDKAQIRDYFDPILISAAVGIRKPDKRIFEELIDAWEEHPNDLVMIGDSLRADIRGAQSAGMHQIWIKAYVDPEDRDLERREVIPEAEVETLKDIPEAVRILQEKG